MIDHLLKNGIIVTVNKEREILYHGAIAIQGNKIVDIGDSDALEKKYTDVAEVTDLDGKVVFLDSSIRTTICSRHSLRGLR